MAQIQVSFQSSLLNSANFFVAAIYDTSNLGTVLEFIAPTKGAGYPNPFQVTFLNSYSANKLYRVILWENTTAVVGGTSRVSSDLKAALNTSTVRTDNFYTYGISSQFTNNTTIVDSTLIGWNISLEQFGTGTLKPGTDYTYDNTTGTIVLINGTTYNNGQEMIVHFQPLIGTPTGGGGGGGGTTGVQSGRIISAANTMTNSDANTAIYLQGSSGSFVVTLPALSTMSDYQPIEFYSAGGSHINATLLAQGSDKIQWKSQITSLILGQAEQVTLFKANGVWNVKNPSPWISLVGEIVDKYSNADFPYQFADGSLLSRATYPRLFAYFSGLSANALIAEASWANATTLDGTTYYLNKGFWTAGDGSTTFRVPVLLNQFIRGADGSVRKPGSSQADAMLSHEHPFAMGGVGGSYPRGEGPVGTVGGDTGGYSLNADMTDVPYNVPGPGNVATILSKTATETRPMNVSLFKLIRI